MNLKEMLKFADEIFYAQTGQHLDDLELAILEGTLQRETYKQIAKNFDCSESRVREVGAELWQKLSDELGEKVSKSNIRSTIERLKVSHVSSFAKDVVGIGIFNFCQEPQPSPVSSPSNPLNLQRINKNTPESPHQDLSEMPELGTFYNRTSELDTLTKWIVQERYRLITITGIGGIGKTSLAVKLVERVKDEFEYVIWRSLEAPPAPEQLENKLVEFFYQSENSNCSEINFQHLALIKYLQKYRCLVVLDDFHSLFCSGALAGKYRPELEKYALLFKKVEQLSHKSCFLLVGLEAIELRQVRSESSRFGQFQLIGLEPIDAEEILKDSGLVENESFGEIVRFYQGNPFWLKNIAFLLQDLGVSVTNLLTNDTFILSENLKDSLQKQYERLSNTERQILAFFSQAPESINLIKFLENTTLSKADAFNAIHSLWRRCWLHKQGSLYTLPPVLRYYLQENL